MVNIITVVVFAMVLSVACSDLISFNRLGNNVHNYRRFRKLNAPTPSKQRLDSMAKERVRNGRRSMLLRAMVMN